MAILASLFSFMSCGTSTSQIGGGNQTDTLDSFSYGLYGTRATPEVEFTVEYFNETECKVIYFNKDSRTSDIEQRDTVFAPASLLQDIGKVVREHKMYKYKERYKSLFKVLDGNAWSMTIKYMNGKRITSGGYAASPKDDGLRVIVGMMRKQISSL